MPWDVEIVDYFYTKDAREAEFVPPPGVFLTSIRGVYEW
jgi:hypothetical protein